MPNYIEWTTDNGDPHIYFIPDGACRQKVLMDLGILVTMPDGSYMITSNCNTTDSIITEAFSEGI